MNAFDDLRLDHVQFYVADVTEQRAALEHGYGFSVRAERQYADHQSLAIGRDDIRFVLTEPQADGHDGAGYLDRHGDGVTDIALGVRDAAEAFAVAVRRGAVPVREPVARDGAVTATVHAFGDVTHTFFQREPGMDPVALPGFSPVSATPRRADTGLHVIDHFAVCLEAGRLDETVRFYKRVLDFRTIFVERIEVGDQAMNSTVVQSESGRVTLTLIEPDPARARGQIDDFLTAHGGPGVQHIAFACDDIVRAVNLLDRGGVEFLDVPDAYYTALDQRTRLHRHSVAALRGLAVLVDEDHDGQLFQIFTRSTHRRRTLFFEVIERFGARTFGSGNIKALYEAVERERVYAARGRR